MIIEAICHLKFGSWTYSGWQVDIMNKSTTVDLSNYIKSGEWDLKNVYVQRNVRYYPCCPDEPFPDVFFYIYIRRRILYYLFNIIFPCVWLSILSLIGFWLPPDSGEKITLGITVLLAFSVFMLLIAENIPATSEMVPLIGVYLTVIMSLTSLSIILTVVVLNLHHAGPVSPKIPENVYFFMTRKVAKWIFMKGTVQIFESNRTNSIQESLNCDSKLFKFKLYDKKFNLMKNLSSCCRSRGFDEIYSSNGAKSAIGILANDRTDLDANDFIKTNYQDTNEKILKTRKLKTSYSSDSEDFHEVIKSRSSEFKDTSYHKSRSPHVKTAEKVNSNGLNVPITKCKCNLCQVKVRRYSNQYQKDLLNILDNFTNNLKECLVKIEKNIVQINSTNEWKLIAMIIDRFLFWIFTFLTILSTFVLLVAIPVLKNRNILSPYKYNEEFAINFFVND
ncbi:neuronal acetylcholine receptor subunit alpha-10-like [Brachionus plicatilis]|uniref:Neuronal acetylcholine receptor subunit alpha-10-like n=1 Tax=Brachionus plicatilis TaxID=10195 RepID=A0A3M7RRT4_BRAPC|nr:neuronal acetylcholine receptor subunit alpha-10-like [Brachionus plicatilis]